MGVKTPAAGLTTRRSVAKRCSPSCPSSSVSVSGTPGARASRSRSRCSGMATPKRMESGRVRLARLLSADPGPSSTKVVNPSSPRVSRV